MTTTPSPLHLVASNGEVEYCSLIEPLQSKDSLEPRGVRNNGMTIHETNDAAQAIVEMKFTTGNALQDTFTKAVSVLTLAGIVTDIKLLDESPTLLNTARGSLARGVASQRLLDLQAAFNIEQLPHTQSNAPEIFGYRRNANEVIAKNPRTNIVRILRAIERSEQLSKEESDMLQRTVGHVMFGQLTRGGRMTAVTR